jgi:PadR family transcriptional regulator, regulatory protein PadR
VVSLISSDVIRGYIDTMILFVLKDKDSYGYEISKEISQISNQQYQIKETTLYSAFSRLEDNGYVTSYYGDETFGKRRTYFTITKMGLSYYRSKCHEWGLTKTVIDQFTKEQTNE